MRNRFHNFFFAGPHFRRDHFKIIVQKAGIVHWLASFRLKLSNNISQKRNLVERKHFVNFHFRREFFKWAEGAADLPGLTSWNWSSSSYSNTLWHSGHSRQNSFITLTRCTSHEGQWLILGSSLNFFFHHFWGQLVKVVLDRLHTSETTKQVVHFFVVWYTMSAQSFNRLSKIYYSPEGIGKGFQRSKN